MKTEGGVTGAQPDLDIVSRVMAAMLLQSKQQRKHPPENTWRPPESWLVDVPICTSCSRGASPDLYCPEDPYLVLKRYELTPPEPEHDTDQHNLSLDDERNMLLFRESFAPSPVHGADSRSLVLVFFDHGASATFPIDPITTADDLQQRVNAHQQSVHLVLYCEEFGSRYRIDRQQRIKDVLTRWTEWIGVDIESDTRLPTHKWLELLGLRFVAARPWTGTPLQIGTHVSYEGTNADLLSPKFIASASSIESLNISRCPHLTVTSDVASRMTALHTLYIRHINTTVMPPFVRLCELAVIDASHNQLGDDAATILATLPYLRVLNLRGNRLLHFPTSLAQLSRLETLILSCNAMTRDADIGRFRRLRTLDVSFNALTSITGHAPKTLVNLFARSNALTRITLLTRPIAMDRVDLRDNRLFVFPHSLNLMRIQTLLLDRNPIDVFRVPCRATTVHARDCGAARIKPHRALLVPGMSLLRRLDLSCAHLSELPKAVAVQMVSIEHLCVDNNLLTKLPSSIANLRRLRTLSASCNKLNAFPAVTGISSLRLLNLAGNNLSVLPRQIFHMQLHTLNLSSNILRSFPGPSSPSPLLSTLKRLLIANNAISSVSLANIAQFCSLRLLDLSANQVFNADLFESLSSIRELRLSHNQLTKLPQLATLQNLRTMYVGENNILSLSNSALPLGNLRVLDISFNLLSQTPQSIIGPKSRRLSIDSSGNVRSGHLQSAQLKPAPTQLERRNSVCSSFLFKNTSCPSASALRALEPALIEQDHLSVANIQGCSPKMDIYFSFTATHNSKATCSSTYTQAFLNLPFHHLAAFFTSTDFAFAQWCSSQYPGIIANEISTHHPTAPPELAAAMRRSFLRLHFARHSGKPEHANSSSAADGCAVFLRYGVIVVGSVGASTVVLSRRGHAIRLTREHDTWNSAERGRVVALGGTIKCDDTLNGSVSTRRIGSRGAPQVGVYPTVTIVETCEDDEFVIYATEAFWSAVSIQTAVDIVRVAGGSQRAAHALRNFAMSFGAEKFSVAVLGLQDKEIRRSPATRIDIDSELSRIEAEVGPPTGRVAIVFVDVEGSTRLWGKLHGSMHAVIKRANSIIQRLQRRCGGYEVKVEGDSWVTAFGGVAAAVEFAVLLQQGLWQSEWPAGLEGGGRDGLFKGLVVRTGISVGVVRCEFNERSQRMGYDGASFWIGQAICDSAQGGQIFVSGEVCAEFESAVKFKEGILCSPVVISVGNVELRGLERSEQLFCIYPRALAGRHELLQCR